MTFADKLETEHLQQSRQVGITVQDRETQLQRYKLQAGVTSVLKVLPTEPVKWMRPSRN